MVGADDHTHKHTNHHRATGLVRNLLIIDNAIESTTVLQAITNTISHSLVSALAQHQHKTKKSRHQGGHGVTKSILYIVLDMVGAAGFEPTTPSPPVKCATRLRYAPTPRGYTRRRSTAQFPFGRNNLFPLPEVTKTK